MARRSPLAVRPLSILARSEELASAEEYSCIQIHIVSKVRGDHGGGEKRAMEGGKHRKTGDEERASYLPSTSWSEDFTAVTRSIPDWSSDRLVSSSSPSKPGRPAAASSYLPQSWYETLLPSVDSSDLTEFIALFTDCSMISRAVPRLYSRNDSQGGDVSRPRAFYLFLVNDPSKPFILSDTS
jgi:hypothetical protein